MKTLILVRHGKSSWKHDLQDFQRPLKKRAYKDAEKVVKAFMKNNSASFVLWTSPAVRALDSARIFQKELDIGEKDFFIKDQLYTFDERTLADIIASCDDSIDHLMIFGHNPAITEVVNSLGNEVFDNIPTTGLSLIRFDANSWKELKDGKTLLNLFPKNL